MGAEDKRERDRYVMDEDRALSTAVLEAIEELKEEDVTKANFQLYDDIDPDALDNLFRRDANANTSVQFNTDGVTVTLWGDGDVQIEVTPRNEEG